MESPPLIITISELRLDATGIVRQASGSSRPVYVTQRGRPAAVMLSRPVYERLVREHAILCRAIVGDLDAKLEPGMTLEEVLRLGQRALEEERLATARELAAEARRLEASEREPREEQAECTLEDLLDEFGIEPRWLDGSSGER